MELTDIKGIGEKTARMFNSLGVFSCKDLVEYFPYRYIPCEEVISIEESRDMDGKNVAVCAYMDQPPRTVRKGRYKITNGIISDYSGKLRCVWFNSPFVASGLSEDEEYVFAGKIRKNGNSAELEHPLIYRKADYVKKAGKMKPVYHTVKQLSQKTVSGAVAKALEEYEFEKDYLPAVIKERYGLEDRETAVRRLHSPLREEELETVRKRVVFDEFLEFIYGVKSRGSYGAGPSEYSIDVEGVKERFLRLPEFELTEDQSRTIDEIYADFKAGKRVNRLIQGDVGSGKTVVAMAAAYAVFLSGYQTAIMVPTEVLAVQHFNSFRKFFGKCVPAPEILLLTGSMKESEKKEARGKIREGKADIIIGTHALIQKNVVFRDLALAVTDEQHRFGVKQRQSVSGEHNHKKPNVMVMSATPIPRTLALILYGDLDISAIRTYPSGRLPVKNAVITEKDRGKAYRTILNEIEKGHQAYIICPAVERDGEASGPEMENVADLTEKIKSILPQNIVVKSLHGRMIQSEKDSIMWDFLNGKIHILVSTTVVEVGVDVPNATVMMIENAERFGLASLHQLRGRVGRGKDQSYCIFVRTGNSGNAKKRLEILGSSNDGFFIAEEDLKLRGPGEILGSEQSGQFRFKWGDVFVHSRLLVMANECADLVIGGGAGMTDGEKDIFIKHMESISEEKDICI